MDTTQKDGAALMVVMIVMMVLGLTAGSIHMLASNQLRTAQRLCASEQAFVVADAAVEDAASYARQLIKTGVLQGKTVGDAFLRKTESWRYSTGQSQQYWQIKKTGIGTCDIYAECEIGGVKRAVIMENMRAGTFAEFSFWTRENGAIYFTGGEEFFGPVHTGSAPNFWSNPVFWDTLSTEADHYGGDISQVTFHKDFLKNTEKGSLAEIDFAEQSRQAHQRGLVLYGETTIKFAGDKMLVTNAQQDGGNGWIDHEVEIKPEEIIYIADWDTPNAAWRPDSPGKLHLRGNQSASVVGLDGNYSMLNGNVSIFTEDDIEIHDHIVYAETPIEYTELPAYNTTYNPDSDDALGLISMDDVRIPLDAPDDLYLHATVMATGVKSPNNPGSFVVDDASSCGIRGNLNLLGGIVQDVRGGVGWFNKNSGAHGGYLKKYAFDTRFKSTPPSYYPKIQNKITYGSIRECQPLPENEKLPSNCYD